jgi:hypothetical protein
MVRSKHRFAICGALLLAGLSAPDAAGAHALGTSYTTVLVGDRELAVEIDFKSEDLVRFPAADRDGDGKVDSAELAKAAPDFERYLAEHASVSADYQPRELVFLGATQTVDEQGTSIARFRFRVPVARPPREIVLSADFSDVFGSDHVNFAKIESGKTIHQGVLKADAPRQSFSLGDISLLEQALTFVKLGVEHIFLGFDHILFLIGLILLGGRLRELVKIVTAFTIAHSVTLSLASLNLVVLPSRWIEAGIALSIAYVACENFFLKEASHRWILAFGFGLVHGFGFANVLRELGLPARGLVSSLLSFNVGVEVGQLCIVAVLFPGVLWITQKGYSRVVVPVVSFAILACGLGWFVERAFGLSFMPF